MDKKGANLSLTAHYRSLEHTRDSPRGLMKVHSSPLRNRAANTKDGEEGQCV